MKAIYTILFLFLICTSQIGAQNESEKNVLDIIEKINPHIYSIPFKKDSIKKKDSIILKNPNKEFNEYLNFVKKIEKLKNFTGSISFGFKGHEVDNSNLYTIDTGIQGTYGVFPLEVEAETNTQTQVNDGKLEENLSSLDISIEYHPKETLAFETYAFVLRTKNKFLNVDQRYEIGGGGVFNIYSAKIKNDKPEGITEEGEKLLNEWIEFEKKYPTKNIDSSETVGTIKKYFKEKKLLDSSAINKLFKVKERHEKVIRKFYSKHRLVLLIGANYEIEKTKDSLSLFSKKADTIINKSFDATNLFRLIIAPKYVVQGKNFKWRNVIYFKIGLFNIVDDIYTNEDVLDEANSNLILDDKLTDYWIDFQTTFEFKLTDKLTLESSLNYIYDNAPKRQYYRDGDDVFKIVRAEDSYTGISFKLKYKF